MNARAKKYLSILLILVIGALIGAGVSTYWFIGGLHSMLYVHYMYITAFEIDEAGDEYVSSSHLDSKLYALEHLIDYYSKFILIEDNIKMSKDMAYGIALAHAKLGVLYEEKGESDNALDNYKKGLDFINRYKLFDSWKDTDKEIKSIDGLRNYVIQTYNKMGEPKKQ